MPKLIGTSGNDVLSTGTRYDELQGLAGDDILTGGADKDKLLGGDGNDWISGGASKDEIDGGAGDDILIGGASGDTILGGTGYDTVSYSNATARVVLSFSATDSNGIGSIFTNLSAGGHEGDAKDDKFTSIEAFIGSDFSDLVGGGEIAMTFSLGKGDDSFDTNPAFNVVDTVHGGAGNDTAWGGTGNDILNGDDGADHLLGEDGDDLLAGGAGADRIDGGSGADTAVYSTSQSAVVINLATGSGTGGDAQGDTFTSIEKAIGSDFDDRFVSGSAANGFTGGNGIDTVDYSLSTASVTVNLGTGKGSAGDAAGDTYSGIENVLGTASADSLTGNADANMLDGRDGDDSLSGGDGADTLQGGQGDDRLYGGAGADTLIGGAGTDTADYRNALAGVVASLATGGSAGEAAGDSFSGIENISGSNFDDILTGDAGDNRIVGRQGSDQLYGGDGDDVLAAGGGYDHQDGGAGIDTVDYSSSWGRVVVDLSTGKGSGAEAANDTYANVENVLGSGFDDKLVGDAGANRLTGGEGLDTLSGGNGNDVLAGGAGADQLNGGAGDRDAADYQSASTGVTLSLATGGTRRRSGGRQLCRCRIRLWLRTCRHHHGRRCDQSSCRQRR